MHRGPRGQIPLVKRNAWQHCIQRSRFDVRGLNVLPHSRHKLYFYQKLGFYSKFTSKFGSSSLVAVSRRFFVGTSFCDVLRSVVGRGENFPGQKSKFFLPTLPREENFDFFFCQPCPGKENFDLFLAMARNWLILVRNLYILARICTFWQDKKEIVDFFFASPTLQG